MTGTLNIAAAQAKQTAFRETARRDRCCGRGAWRRARRLRRSVLGPA